MSSRRCHLSIMVPDPIGKQTRTLAPAEWLFATALLLLDRGDPEERVGRMYR